MRARRRTENSATEKQEFSVRVVERLETGQRNGAKDRYTRQRGERALVTGGLMEDKEQRWCGVLRSEARGEDVGNGRRRSSKTLVTAIGAGDCKWNRGDAMDGGAVGWFNRRSGGGIRSEAMQLKGLRGIDSGKAYGNDLVVEPACGWGLDGAAVRRVAAAT
eukprot:jgi/Psemu1/15040/gm1.15040_g